MYPYSYVTKSRYIENNGNIAEALESIRSEYKTKDITLEDFMKSLTFASALKDQEHFDI